MRSFLNLDNYDFLLPRELIASKPSEVRGNSRLLVLEREIKDRTIDNLVDYLDSGDLLVINDTKVLKARLKGKRSTGGSVEVFIERINKNNNVQAQVRSNRKIQKGDLIYIEGSQVELKVLEKKGYLNKVKFSIDPRKVLEDFGKVPLPPYIQREATDLDKERYQTIYADEDKKNSVAAPTAGLHFNQTQIKDIRNKGIKIVKITLDIGLGTFMPIKSNIIEDHEMHTEKIHLNEGVIEEINKAKHSNSKVIAVGTTSLRCLESVHNKFGELRPYEGETNLYIYPGYKFKVVDSLFTNFHLPKSSLFLLVCAFGGTTEMKKAYSHAIKKGYKFFSYGDAMLINKKQ